MFYQNFKNAVELSMSMYQLMYQMSLTNLGLMINSSNISKSILEEQSDPSVTLFGCKIQ